MDWRRSAKIDEDGRGLAKIVAFHGGPELFQLKDKYVSYFYSFCGSAISVIQTSLKNISSILARFKLNMVELGGTARNWVDLGGTRRNWMDLGGTGRNWVDLGGIG